MVLDIGPTAGYLILAVAFLVVLGGGTFMAYYMDRQRSQRRAAQRPESGR